ncbi:MAG: FAD-dependent oxidoreductase, partial [Cyanobacteria bacterium J06639_1]
MMRKLKWAALGTGVAFVGGMAAGLLSAFVRPLDEPISEAASPGISSPKEITPERKDSQNKTEAVVEVAAVATPVPTRSPIVRPTASPSSTPVAQPRQPILQATHDWPLLDVPVKPRDVEVWECEVVVIGGSLGGVAAASHAMRAGAQTCTFELTSWMGGQVSSQAVSAIDESPQMRQLQNFSPAWLDFKRAIQRQTVSLPPDIGFTEPIAVSAINSCWVGDLCFPPLAGHLASVEVLEAAHANSPDSRWQVNTAFKGVEFNDAGDRITAVYAVGRTPRDPDYMPLGRLSREIHTWYAWGSNDTFEKTPIRLQAPPGKTLTVIDATDTGELVGWANIPHRLGSESQATTGEINARVDNPDCTQAYTYPFVMAIADDGGKSRARIGKLQTGFSKAEHRADFDLEGFPMFSGQSVFNYRRIVSQAQTNPFVEPPIAGDMTVMNWNRGNDWAWMNPPLILSQAGIDEAGQRDNWLGGLHPNSLKEAENHALLFSEWLMQNQALPGYAMAHLSGQGSPIPTASGLS